MKKLFILLLILLSTQLYGCSKHTAEPKPTSETTKTVLSTPEVPSTQPETLLIEKNNTNETDTSTFIQDIPLQSEETISAIDDNYYHAATSIPRSEVESYAARIKQLFLEHDWTTISSEISYPITISGTTYNNSTDFLAASDKFEENLKESFFSAIEKEDCTEMFCNWEGIMLGESGQIWIGEVLNTDLTSQGLKIIAINESE